MVVEVARGRGRTVIRLTGGTARGRVLRARIPEGVRPTAARTREALFSILGQDLRDATFLDAFGGTGVMGFEAWSRGAQVIIFEHRPMVARWIRTAAEQLGVTCDVRTGDVLRLAPNLPPQELVYVDPPYGDRTPDLRALASLTRTCLVYEHDINNPTPEVIGELVREQVRAFGRGALAFYRPLPRKRSDSSRNRKLKVVSEP